VGALVGGGIAAVLSLCVLSRVLGDNPLYRLAQSLAVGIALGYVTAVVVRGAIALPLDRLLFGQAVAMEWVVMLGGLGLGLLLVTRFGRQHGSYWANLPLALVFGVGAAIALVGAVRGTLAPQLFATIRLAPLAGSYDQQIGTGILVALTVTTLLAFTYTSSPKNVDAEGNERRGPLTNALRLFGRGSVLMAFGVFFAATVTTYLSALVAQLAAISQWVETLWVFTFGT